MLYNDSISISYTDISYMHKWIITQTDSGLSQPASSQHPTIQPRNYFITSFAESCLLKQKCVKTLIQLHQLIAYLCVELAWHDVRDVQVRVAVGYYN